MFPASEKASDRELVQTRLKHWQNDPDLAGLRDKDVVVFDDKGKQTLSKPLSINIPKDFDELPNKDYVTVPIGLFLSRVGQYTVEIEAIDNVNKGKTTKFSFPLKVVDPSAVK